MRRLPRERPGHATGPGGAVSSSSPTTHTSGTGGLVVTSTGPGEVPHERALTPGAGRSYKPRRAALAPGGSGCRRSRAGRGRPVPPGPCPPPKRGLGDRPSPRPPGFVPSLPSGFHGLPQAPPSTLARVAGRAALAGGGGGCGGPGLRAGGSHGARSLAGAPGGAAPTGRSLRAPWGPGLSVACHHASAAPLPAEGAPAGDGPGGGASPGRACASASAPLPLVASQAAQLLGLGAGL